jgi:hypothetical protein
MKTLFAALLLLMTGAAFAQTSPVLTFTAGTTTGAGSVVPVLTWSTTPAASACAASGDAAWTGAKAVAGTQTLAAITSSKTYNLTCSWNDVRVTVKWTPATQNEDGTPYTDPKSVEVFGSKDLTTVFTPTASFPVKVDATSPQQATIGPLSPGTWYFGTKSLNQAGVESAASQIVSKVVSATSATRSVGVTVNPVPLPPSNVTVE